MRHADHRPAAGAAAAVAGSAAEVDAALELVEAGLGRLARVDAAALPEDCVTAAVRRLGRLDGRLDGIQARLVAAAEAAGVPERSGASSTTAWLSRQTGRSGGHAARTSRLAKAAESAPELTDAVANGDIGPDHASTIAAGLERDELEPDDLAELLPAARRQSPDMFGRHARQLAGRRRQQRLRDRELVARAERHHRHWRTPDGSLRYEGQLPPVEGDLLEKAMSAFYQPDGKDVPDDQRRTHTQRSADAMSALLEAALRSGAAGDVGGVRPHINVAVPMEAMAPLRDAEDAGLTGVTDLGTVLSMAAFTKLACDARFRRVVIDPESRPLDVGRATRQWPTGMRAAIATIDGGCRGPGCELPPHRCIVHHIRWWRSGGPTSASNGTMLCGHHHDLVHDDGWTLRMDPATRRCTWTAPDGSTTVTTPRGLAARPSVDTPPVNDAPAADRATGAESRPGEPPPHPRRSSLSEPSGRPRGRGDAVAPRVHDPTSPGPGSPGRASPDRASQGRASPGRDPNGLRHSGSDPPRRDRDDRSRPVPRDATTLQFDL